MDILQKIVEHKKMEVLGSKQKHPLSSLMASPLYRRKAHVISPAPEKGKARIIAEFKRRSPSRGDINKHADPRQVARAYAAAGVAAMSILTDSLFFGGSLGDLQKVRDSMPDLVLLRKDFIIDPYQLHESSAYGADMVLLIAAILDPQEVEDLALEAASLGLQVLFEVHDAAELEKHHRSIGYVGVNNRDLKTFQVDTRRSLDLLPRMPPGVVPVSESGLNDPDEIGKLSTAGYRLFLMGEAFMKEKDPGRACKNLIEQL